MAFLRGLRLPRLLRKKTKTNPKCEQTQNTNLKYEQTQNTKGFRSPRLQGVVYCNSAIVSKKKKKKKKKKTIALVEKSKIRNNKHFKLNNSPRNARIRYKQKKQKDRVC